MQRSQVFGLMISDKCIHPCNQYPMKSHHVFITLETSFVIDAPLLEATTSLSPRTIR